MTADQNAASGWNEDLLHAYHDGELSALARWRFERALRRSPALQRELAALRAMRGALQDIDAERAAPDLWDALAPRLPTAAARRREAGRERSGGRGLIWWLAPLGAAAATAAVALALFYGELFGRAHADGGTLRWIDSEGQSVMVLDDDPDTTIIWVLDGATEGAARGGPSDVV